MLTCIILALRNLISLNICELLLLLKMLTIAEDVLLLLHTQLPEWFFFFAFFFPDWLALLVLLFEGESETAIWHPTLFFSPFSLLSLLFPLKSCRLCKAVSWWLVKD